MSDIATLVAELRRLREVKERYYADPYACHENGYTDLSVSAYRYAAERAITPTAQGGGGLLEYVEHLVAAEERQVAVSAGHWTKIQELRDELASALLGREEMQRDNSVMAASLDMVRQSEGLKTDVIDELERLRRFRNAADVLEESTLGDDVDWPRRRAAREVYSTELMVRLPAERVASVAAKPTKEHCPRRLIGEELPKHLPCDTGDFSRDKPSCLRSLSPEEFAEVVPPTEAKLRAALDRGRREVERRICQTCGGTEYHRYDRTCPACNGTGVQS